MKYGFLGKDLCAHIGLPRRRHGALLCVDERERRLTLLTENVELVQAIAHFGIDRVGDINRDFETYRLGWPEDWVSTE